jgi:general secretion pathway protein J
MVSRARGAASGGFALIEALASLVVVGMISLLVFQGVGMGRRVWEGIDNVATTEEAIEGAQEAVRGRIEQMYPATLYGGDEALADIKGDADSLEFLAPPNEAKRPAPLRRYRLELTVGRQLVLSSMSDVISTRDPHITRQVLLTGVQQIDLSYYGAAQPDLARQWRSTWYQQVAPPELVRVRVAFPRGDRRSWPDLIVRPLTNIDSNCVLSSATSRCRGRG